MFRFRPSPAIAAAVLLSGLVAGCAHVPAATAWKMRGFDPMTADPALLRAAVAAPAGLVPAKGGANLVFSQARRDGSDQEKIEIDLEETSLAAETGLARVKPHEGQILRAYRIPAADVPRLVEMRTRFKERAAKEPGAFTGNLSVGLAGCRVEGVALPEHPRLSSWIRTEQTDGYLPLLDDVDLSTLVDRPTFERAPTCPAS